MGLIDMIFDLITGNLFVLIALFVFISSLIGRMRGGSRTTGRPSGRGGMPPFGGDGQQGEPRRFPPQAGPEPGMSRADPERPTPSPYWEERLDPEQERYGDEEPYDRDRDRYDEELYDLPPAAPAYTEAPIVPAPVAAPPKVAAPAAPAAPASPRRRAAAHPLALNARNAAHGMIWSEVFGPPRALRSHEPRRRK